MASVSAEAGIRAMPTFCVYQNAAKVDQLVGPNDTSLEALIKKYNGDNGTTLNMANTANSNVNKNCNIL